MKQIRQRQPSLEKINTVRYLTKMLLFLALFTGGLFFVIYITKVSWPESLPGLLLLSAGMVGLVITFRWESAGGVIALLSGIGLGIYAFLTAEANAFLMAAFYGSPFIICGALTLFCCQMQSQDLAQNS